MEVEEACSMTIIVPYRNRKDHLDQFIPHMRAYLPDAKIVVVEQGEGKPFNRGKLINVGFKEICSTHFIAHDVDLLPVKVNYDQKPGVTQLASSDIQRYGYLGGVTMFDKETFERAGGYRNDYFHRAEDNEMNFNLHRLKIPISYRHGKFNELPHPRTAPEFIPELWEKAQQPRLIQNQLAVCTYSVISKVEYNTHTLITVEI